MLEPSLKDRHFPPLKMLCNFFIPSLKSLIKTLCIAQIPGCSRVLLTSCRWTTSPAASMTVSCCMQKLWRRRWRWVELRTTASTSQWGRRTASSGVSKRWSCVLTQSRAMNLSEVQLISYNIALIIITYTFCYCVRHNDSKPAVTRGCMYVCMWPNAKCEIDVKQVYKCCLHFHLKYCQSLGRKAHGSLSDNGEQCSPVNMQWGQETGPAAHYWKAPLNPKSD